MKDKEILMKLGLTEKESKTYLLALDLGSVSSGDLIKKLNVYSKTAYELLNKLVEKGFLSYSRKDRIKRYFPLNPENIMNIIKEKQLNLEETKTELQTIMPSLVQRKISSQSNHQATIYEGKKGIKLIFDSALKDNKEILVFGGGGKFKELFPDYSELWHKQRVNKKIKLKLLYDKSLKNKSTKYPLCEIKYLPKEFNNPAPSMILNNKVILSIWKENPITIEINSKEVSDSYKSYFNLLWKIAKIH